MSPILLKRTTALLTIAGFLTVFGADHLLAQQRAQAADDIEVLQLQQNVHLIAGAGGNIVVQIGADGVVVVDTTPNR